MIGVKSSGLVLDVARQRGGAMPSVVTLHDHSRMGNHGAMTDVTWSQLPSGLWVMSFNGTSSDVNCGNNPSLDLAITISIEAWVLIHTDINGFLVAKGNPAAAGGGYGLFLLPTTDVVRFYSNAAHFTSNAVFTPNNVWFHLVVTNNSLVGGCIFYKNAVGAGWGTRAIVSNVDNLHIGNHSGAAGWVDVKCALLRIYTYALTPAQIRSRFTATRRFLGV